MVKKISVIDVETNEDDKLDTEEDIVSEDEEEEVNKVSFSNPAMDKNNIKNDITIKQKTVDLHQCPDCLKFMTSKSLRYSHIDKCTARFQQEEKTKKPAKEKPIANEKLKKETQTRQSEYEELRQTTPKPQIQKVEVEAIQPVRMKTMREQKQERYTNMMENTF